jgi:hypothetical protein
MFVVSKPSLEFGSQSRQVIDELVEYLPEHIEDHNFCNDGMFCDRISKINTSKT